MSLPPIAAQAAATAAARSTPTNVVIIGRGRWLEGLLKPDENGKFSGAVLIQPGFDLDVLESSIDEAKMKTFGGDIRKHTGLRLPLSLATDKGTYAGYDPGVYLIRASTKRSVKVVDCAGKVVPPEVVPIELYDGRWIEMHVGPYGYNMNGNKGVALGLNAIQVLDAGEQIGRAASNFGTYAAPMESATSKSSSQSAWG